ncbi:MAG TPA: isoprenylcysteine carboxylmethyltransferase family protein [Devosia sp.]|nr:isoprenylcysteine carboxylmethyltransferase family protein [Devosia sp.]
MAQSNVDSSAVAKSLVALLITLIVMAVVLFLPAGTLDWPRAWWFCAAFVAATLIAIAALWRLNPEIFAARSRVQAGTKSLDYLFITIVMGGFFLILPVAGLDFRFGGANAPDWVVWLGYVLFAIAYFGEAWPQAVNRHFEPGIRIQEDRGQTVIDTGPYAFVRHPGYIFGTLLAISMALMLGSYWALIPALAVGVGLVPRTLFEEQTLRAELPGYTEYTQRVKWRWVPGVW